MEDSESEINPLLPVNDLKPSPYYICIPAFLSVLAAAMVVGIQQQWLLSYLCSRYVTADLHHKPTLITEFLPGAGFNEIISNIGWKECSRIPEIQSIGAKWSMVISLAVGIPALISGPVLGAMSDRYGRKPLYLLGLFSTTLFFIAYIIVSKFNVGLWFVVLAGVLSGIGGSYFGMINACLGYFADTTISGSRSSVFVFGESCFFAGFAIGPFLGGYLARNMLNGSLDVFYIAVGSKMVIFVSTLLFLPESLSQQEVEFRNPLNSLKTISKNSNFTFISIVVALILTSIASYGVRALFFYYVSFRFSWDAQDEGQYFLILSFSKLMYMLIVFPCLKFIFQTKKKSIEYQTLFDISIVRLALLISGICTILQSMASKGWILYFIPIIDGFSTLAGPIVSSIMSDMVSEESQGLLFSSLQFLNQFFGLFSTILFPILWTVTVKGNIPQFFFYVVSLMNILSFALYMGISSIKVLNLKRSNDEPTSDT